MSHAPLRQVVLGDHRAVAARLDGFALRNAGSWPVMVAGSGWVDGHVLDLTADQAARLGHFMAAVGHQACDVRLGQGPATAFQAAGAGSGPWVIGDWQGRFADIFTAAAEDIMRLIGRVPPDRIAPRLNLMLVRAASRLRALNPAPTALRHHAGPADVRVTDQRQPYANFFAVEEYDIGWRRFDGQMNPPAPRSGFIVGDAVTVLPYDPARDRVLVIEQFRAGPFARGDRQPWSLEAIAGRIDPGETPQDAGRREAAEEAGLTLTDLLPVASYYPSPGAVSEYLYSYVALTDLPDGIAGVYGVADEAEDIRGHLIPFAQLMQLVASGEANNAPLILSALWLQRERPRLRQGHASVTPPV